MLRYLAIRVLSTIPVLVFVALLIFSLLHLVPGDPALLIAGDNASPEQVEVIRASLHLDQPLPVQFIIWANDLVHLDFGESVFSKRPVIELIGQRIEFFAGGAIAAFREDFA